MDPGDIVRTVAALLVGVGAGALSGMLGIGGAVVSTPALRVLGATPIQAVGSTVPAILPGAVSGTWRYHKAGIVNWRVGLVCGFAGSVFAVVGAAVADASDARYLMVATAGLMLWSGFSVARSGRRRAGLAGRGGRSVSATVPALAAVGAVAGFVAGLLGVGGGIVMVPVFTSVLRLPVKEAVASSLVSVAIFSVPALAAHTYYGNIDWSLAVPVMVGAVVGAQFGTRLTLRVSDTSVRRWFGILIVALALVYGGAELWAIVVG